MCKHAHLTRCAVAEHTMYYRCDDCGEQFSVKPWVREDIKLKEPAA